MEQNKNTNVVMNGTIAKIQMQIGMEQNKYYNLVRNGTKQQ